MLVGACAPAMSKDEAVASLPKLRQEFTTVVGNGRGATICSEDGRERFKAAAKNYLIARRAAGDAGDNADEEQIDSYLTLGVLTGVIGSGDLPPELSLMVMFARAAMKSAIAKANAEAKPGEPKIKPDLFAAASTACVDVVDLYALSARAGEMEERMQTAIERDPEREWEIREDYRSRIETVQRQIEAKVKAVTRALEA
jgi:hypothetical protein